MVVSVVIMAFFLIFAVPTLYWLITDCDNLGDTNEPVQR